MTGSEETPRASSCPLSPSATQSNNASAPIPDQPPGSPPSPDTQPRGHSEPLGPQHSANQPSDHLPPAAHQASGSAPEGAQRSGAQRLNTKPLAPIVVPNLDFSKIKVFAQPGAATTSRARLLPEKLPLINTERSRKMAFPLRQDGYAAINPKLQKKVKSTFALPQAGGGPSLLHEKITNAVAHAQHRRNLAVDLQGAVHEIVAEQKKLPSVGTRVVVAMKRPFVGQRVDGVVRYVGNVPQMGQGILVGVELDEAVGHHNGLGYFQCRKEGAYWGVFVRGNQIEYADMVTPGMKKAFKVGKLAVENPGWNRKWWENPFSAGFKASSGFSRVHSHQ